MRQTKTQAIIMKRVNFGEADRILQVITSDQGRISLLAKAVRKPKSKLAGGLELFSISDISYIEGKSEIKTLVSARLDKHFKNIVESPEKLMLAYDFLQYIEAQTQHGSDKNYFSILQTTLSELNNKQNQPSIVYIWFVVNALILGGHGINLEKPLKNKVFSEEDRYEFSYDDMAFAKSERGSVTAKHIKLLKICEKVDTPKPLSRVVDVESLTDDLVQISKNLIKINRA